MTLCGACGNKKKDVRDYNANEIKMECGLLFICLLPPLRRGEFFFILYTVSSLISLTYCEEPVVKGTGGA